MVTAGGHPQGHLPQEEEWLESAITEENVLLALLHSRVQAVVKGEVKFSHTAKIIYKTIDSFKKVNCIFAKNFKAVSPTIED